MDCLWQNPSERRLLRGEDRAAVFALWTPPLISTNVTMLGKSSIITANREHVRARCNG